MFYSSGGQEVQGRARRDLHLERAFLLPWAGRQNDKTMCVCWRERQGTVTFLSGMPCHFFFFFM